jgi:hypothetical protein
MNRSEARLRSHHGALLARLAADFDSGGGWRRPTPTACG